VPRTEVYQLRLTTEEKELLAHRAKTKGISIAKMIRRAVGLEEELPNPSDGIPVNPVPKASHASKDEAYNRLVQRNHKRMGLKAAESLARRELDA